MADGSIPVAIADTNALMRLINTKDPKHEATRQAIELTGHLVISPMVLAEADYLITDRVGPTASANMLRFIAGQVDRRRFEVPHVAPCLRTALTVMECYQDARGGNGICLTDAVNVVLADQFRTNAMVTTDSDYRMIRPLDAHEAFRLLPQDL